MFSPLPPFQPSPTGRRNYRNQDDRRYSRRSSRSPVRSWRDRSPDSRSRRDTERSGIVRLCGLQHHCCYLSYHLHVLLYLSPLKCSQAICFYLSYILFFYAWSSFIKESHDISSPLLYPFIHGLSLVFCYLLVLRSYACIRILMLLETQESGDLNRFLSFLFCSDLFRLIIPVSTLLELSF